MNFPKKYVPGYTYGSPENKDSLFQGDIIEVTGTFRLRFKKYYPKITHDPCQRKFAMVLSQSCDLARRLPHGGQGPVGRPNLNHITVCIVRPFKSVLTKELELSGAKKLNDFYLLSSPKYEATLTKASRLINNSEAKNFFFLPKIKDVLTEDSVAVLNISFAFRTSAYDELLKHRVASLYPEFRAKVGFLLADYYGRVATPDLNEHGWSQDDLFLYTKRALKNSGIVDADSDEFIRSAKGYKTIEEIEAAVENFRNEQEMKAFASIIRAARKQSSDDLFKLLRDVAEVRRLQGLKDFDLRREISNRLKNVISEN